jgi:hypothetical protein
MATEFNWVIVTCEHEVATGGIIVVHWSVSATDGGYAAGAYGTAGFTPDPEAADFVPYEDLTEADVLGWIFAQDSFSKEDTEANLQKQIDAQKEPATITGTPW